MSRASSRGVLRLSSAPAAVDRKRKGPPAGMVRTLVNAPSPRLLLLVSLLAAACAPRALDLSPDHPARPDAPPGRLAGPPPALIGAGAPAAGGAVPDAPAAGEEHDHAGHGDADAPAPPAPSHDHH